MRSLLKSIFDERNRAVLASIIQEYISTAEPVGSRRIAKWYDPHLSSATIRNIMQDLEDYGYLSKTHTSSGRIPTDKGLRFYVDTILEIKGLSETEKEELEGKFRIGGGNIKDMLRETSKLLSLFSHHAGIVVGPRFDNIHLNYIQFIKLSGNKIFLAYLFEEGIIENRIIEIEETLTSKELERIVKYLNRMCSGLTLGEIRSIIMADIKKEKMLYDNLLSKVLSLGGNAFEKEPLAIDETNVYIEGKANLLNFPEFSAIKKMRLLLLALEEKSILLKLLDKSMKTEGVQIYIGQENELEGIEECSLVTSNYTHGDYIVGTLGIIGPKRMNYQEIIPLVDYASKLVSRFFDTR